jgi:hypothetical protein
MSVGPPTPRSDKPYQKFVGSCDRMISDARQDVSQVLFRIYAVEMYLLTQQRVRGCVSTSFA